jgi:hypothetical protein
MTPIAALLPAPPAPVPTQPVPWGQPNFRACERCVHGKAGDCRSPDVMWHSVPVPFAAARRLGGPCGPEAEHLDFPGLRA